MLVRSYPSKRCSIVITPHFHFPQSYKWGGVQKCRASAAVDRQCSRPSAHTHARSSLVVVVVVGPLSLCSAKFRVRGSAEVQRAKAPTSLSISTHTHTHTHPVPPDPSSHTHTHTQYPQIPRVTTRSTREKHAGRFLVFLGDAPLPAPTVLLAGQDNELEQRDATPQDSPISTIRVQCV